MKVTRKNFIRSLEAVKKFVGKSTPMSTMVLIDAGAGKMYATDFETYATVGFDANVFQKPDKLKLEAMKRDDLMAMANEASLTLPPKAKKADIIEAIMTIQPPEQTSERFCVDPSSLLNLLRTEAQDEVDIKVHESGAMIFVGRNFRSIPIVSDEGWTAFPTMETGTELFTLNKRQAQALGSMTVGNDEKRDHLLNAWFDGSAIYCTDLKRLYQIKPDNMGQIQTPYLGFPKYAIQKAGTLTEKKMRLIYDGGNYVAVYPDGGEVIEILMQIDKDSDYPNTSGLVSKHELLVHIKKEDIEKICKRACQMTNDSYQGAKFYFNGGIKCFIQNPTKGEYEESIHFKDAIKIEPELEIGLNPKYIGDAVNVVASDTVEMSIKDSEHCVTIADPNDPTFMSVIMPMRM